MYTCEAAYIWPWDRCWDGRWGITKWGLASWVPEHCEAWWIATVQGPDTFQHSSRKGPKPSRQNHRVVFKIIQMNESQSMCVDYLESKPGTWFLTRSQGLETAVLGCGWFLSYWSMVTAVRPFPGNSLLWFLDFFEKPLQSVFFCKMDMTVAYILWRIKLILSTFGLLWHF